MEPSGSVSSGPLNQRPMPTLIYKPSRSGVRRERQGMAMQFRAPGNDQPPTRISPVNPVSADLDLATRRPRKWSTHCDPTTTMSPVR